MMQLLSGNLAFLALMMLILPKMTGSHHSSSGSGGSGGSSQRHLQKRLEEVFHRFSPLVKQHATLNHGDHCISPYEEKLRQQIVEELHLIATSRGHITVGRVKDAIRKMEEFISMNDKELCNYRLSLVCDPDRRRCVCAGQGGLSRDNFTFTWEQGRCRYSEGSMCSPGGKIECVQETECQCQPSGSSLCFCQGEFPTTTTTTTTTTTVAPVATTSTFDTEENDDFDDDEESDDEDDDDDDGDGEQERIILVNIGEQEESSDTISITSTATSTSTSTFTPFSPENVFQQGKAATPEAPVPTRRQELTSAIRRLEKDVEAVKSLNFGESCESLSEESNYAEYQRLVNDMDCVTGENDEENLVEILQKLENILAGGNLMCNWSLHLQCNSQSKRCECRSSSEDLDGFYLLFMAEGKKCVLVENSRCLSKEYFLSKKGPFQEQIPCSSGTKCVAEETKAECKTKIENCFCRKIVEKKPVGDKQKKKVKTGGGGGGSKTSGASPPLSSSRTFSLVKIANLFYVSIMIIWWPGESW